MLFRKATRSQAKLRLALTGTAGSGKTYSALLIAFGIGGKIAMIDTENGSGDLYSSLGDYDICNINAPFDPKKYIQAIHEAERAGYDIIIIDSLTPAWNGEGGICDMQGKIEAQNGNGFYAWRNVTPLHRKLIETILNSQCHIIATIRTKTEYALVENEKGKKEFQKIGLAPVQREGIEYEFSLIFDISPEKHIAKATKDRTTLFDGQYFTITPEIGEKLRDWLNSGDTPTTGTNFALNKRAKGLYERFIIACNNDKQQAKDAMLSLVNGRTSKEWTEEDLNKFEEVLKSYAHPQTETPEQTQNDGTQVDPS